MEENPEEYNRVCPICSRPVKGRNDKVFCSDYCRNVYNNLRNSDRNNYIRNINNILRKNRRVLESLISTGEYLCKVRRETLADEGFDFRYHTHIHQGPQGELIYFIYDLGYQVADSGWILISKSNRGEV